LSLFWTNDKLAPAIGKILNELRDEGSLVLAAPVYAELLAIPKISADFIDSFAESQAVGIEFDLDETIWRDAGWRFAQYADRRRKSRGGQARRFLADFLIGSHALLRADRLLTFDAGRYQKDYPELEIIGLES
jgi:predicted nucleic acid-binding protein